MNPTQPRNVPPHPTLPCSTPRPCPTPLPVPAPRPVITSCGKTQTFPVTYVSLTVMATLPHPFPPILPPFPPSRFLLSLPHTIVSPSQPPSFPSISLLHPSPLHPPFYASLLLIFLPPSSLPPLGLHSLLTCTSSPPVPPPSFSHLDFPPVYLPLTFPSPFHCIKHRALPFFVLRLLLSASGRLVILIIGVIQAWTPSLLPLRHTRRLKHKSTRFLSDSVSKATTKRVRKPY